MATINPLLSIFEPIQVFAFVLNLNLIHPTALPMGRCVLFEQGATVGLKRQMQKYTDAGQSGTSPNLS